MTSSRLYANVYVVLVAHPGVGKTRVIRAARSYMLDVPEFHMAPTSLTAASMIDTLMASKRTIMQLPDPPLEYNTMTLAPDELGSFVHKYDNEMISVLSSFYDPDPYGHNRRGADIKIKIKSPQLNMLCGATPNFLMEFMPEAAWGQGFTSRLMLVFTDERIVGDDFAQTAKGQSPDLLADLKTINGLIGEYKVTEEYRSAVNDWRALGEPPVPNHPKLLHYATRRRAHLYKLSMVSAIDRSNTLLLTKDDFNRALGWMIEIEQSMPEIFKAGATNVDGKAMDELVHYIKMLDLTGLGINEQKCVDFLRKQVPAHSVMRVLDVMVGSGLIRVVSTNPKTGLRSFGVIKTEAARVAPPASSQLS